MRDRDAKKRHALCARTRSANSNTLAGILIAVETTEIKKSLELRCAGSESRRHGFWARLGDDAPQWD